MRNLKLTELQRLKNRTSETEEQRKESLRIKREKDRARRRTKGKKRSPDTDVTRNSAWQTGVSILTAVSILTVVYPYSSTDSGLCLDSGLPGIDFFLIVINNTVHILFSCYFYQPILIKILCVCKNA